MSMFNPFFTDTITLVYDIVDSWGELVETEEVDIAAKLNEFTTMQQNWRGAAILMDKAQTTALVSKDVDVSAGQIVKIDGERRTVHWVQPVKDFQLRAKRLWIG